MAALKTSQASTRVVTHLIEEDAGMLCRDKVAVAKVSEAQIHVGTCIPPLISINAAGTLTANSIQRHTDTEISKLLGLLLSILIFPKFS